MAQKNTKKYIEKSLKLSEDINKILTRVYKNVEITNMESINEFLPYNEPKTNLDGLLAFYELFISVHTELKEIKREINEALGSEYKINEIGEINKFDLLNKGYSIDENLKKLDDYKSIKIVLDLFNEYEAIFELLNDSISEVYFDNLLNIDQEIKDMKEISSYLLRFTEEKSFLSRYSSEIYKKTSFDDIKNNKEMLLERTRDVDGIFYNMNIYNTDVLGERQGNKVNLGLNKILIINLKKIIVDVLSIIENEENIENVPFLINLNVNLKHSEDKNIEEVDELFIFKNEINKILCNTFLVFLDEVERLDEPNKYCDSEELSLGLKKALDCIIENQKAARKFIKDFGPYFKVNTIDEFIKKMSNTLAKKIQKLSENLYILKQNIYLINNFYLLRRFLDHDTVINENVASIINVLRNELQNRPAERLTKFIDSNMRALTSYTLPEDVRQNIIPIIKKTVWEEIGKKEYTGNQNTLNENINNLFLGK